MFKSLKLNLIMLGVAGLILAGGFYYVSSVLIIPKIVSAEQTETKLTGYAWSENIGYIDFSTSTKNIKGITVDANGYLSGYAWSENIGWIKFGGFSNFPKGVRTISQNAQIILNNKLIGWAKACGGMYDMSLNQTSPNNSCIGTSRTDGWDGWISFSGFTVDDNFNYEVLLNDGENFSGYAWGSDVLGWISFYGTTTDNHVYGVSLLSAVIVTPITIDLSANPPSPILSGASSIISWSSTGADSCSIIKEGDSLWDGTGTSSFKNSGNLTATTTFLAECKNNNNIERTSITIYITYPKPPGEELTIICTLTPSQNYVNKTTIWDVKLFDDKGNEIPKNDIQNIKTIWNGTEIKEFENNDLKFSKIYVTIGKKTINIESTGSINTKPFIAKCSATAIMKLDSGSNEEI